MLEVIQEVGVAGTVTHRGREQLASESLLLRAAPLRKVHEHGIEKQRIDIALFPAHVEVGRVAFGGHEASVDVRATASGVTQRVQRTLETGEQLAVMARPPNPEYPGAEQIGLLVIFKEALRFATFSGS